MPGTCRHALIVADIEGSSGCWNPAGSAFLTREWTAACLDMSRDVDTAAGALFASGIGRVTVADFHRTGYNILPEMLDSRVELRSGYPNGPVPGLGNPAGIDAVLFVGLHAASGTEGFLAHTFTSRLAGLTLGDRPLGEAELFSAVLAPYGIRPLFFSGCPSACAQAAEALPGIATYGIDKSKGPAGVDKPDWRRGLHHAVRRATAGSAARPHILSGPLRAELTFREGPKAARIVARRWGLEVHRDRIVIRAAGALELYTLLTRVCYLTPAIDRMLPLGLFLYRGWGLAGRCWVRYRRRIRSC